MSAKQQALLDEIYILAMLGQWDEMERRKRLLAREVASSPVTPAPAT